MMSKTSNRFSPEVRSRAVRLLLDHEGEHPSRWSAVTSIATKIGCTAQTLNEWVKKAEVDRGVRAGVPIEVGERLKALERENRELRQANEILDGLHALGALGSASNVVTLADAITVLLNHSEDDTADNAKPPPN